MKYRDFEKHISDSYQQDSAPVDTDMLLANMGLPVPSDSKKIFGWYKLLGLLLLVMSGVTLAFLLNNNKSNANSNITSNVQLESELNNGSKKTDSNIINLSIAVTETEIDDLNEEENSVNNISENKLNQDEILKTNTEDNDLNKSEKNIINSKSDRSNKNLNDSNIEFDNPIKKIVNNNFSKQLNAQNKSSNNTSEVPTIVNIENTNIEALEIRSLDEVSSIDKINFSIRSESILLDLPEPECPSFSNKTPLKFSLLAEVGVMKPFKDLQSINGSSSNALSFRDSVENSKEAIQVGLHLKLSKGNAPWYVRAGAAYTRIAEQMNEEYSYIERDTTKGLISITTSMTGDTITAIYGDVVTETLFSGRSSRHYFLHLIDIPVAIGYEVPLGSSFYIGGEVGAQFNIRTSGSGLIYRDVNDYADLSEVKGSTTQVGLSYFGGIHVGKHLSSRSSIQLSTRFRYYPSYFSNVDPNIEQRYHLAGVHAGYVYRF